MTYVIENLTPDPTGSPHWIIAIGSGLKFGQAGLSLAV